MGSLDGLHDEQEDADDTDGEVGGDQWTGDVGEELLDELGSGEDNIGCKEKNI